MKDQNTTNKKLIEEISILKKRIQELEKSEAQRKRMEETLRENEMKYQTLVETTNTGFVILDEKGIVLDANPEYIRLTGHNQLSDVLGRSVIEWTADYEKEKNKAAVMACFQAGYIRNLEIDYVDSKGHITPIEINATCMEVEAKTRILTLCRNIADRRWAQEALRESEEKYRILLSESSDPIFSLTSEGQYKYVNKAFSSGVGKPVENIIGKTVWDVFPKEEADKRFSSLSQVFRTGEEKVIEVRVPRADGDRYYITTITPIKDTKGEMLSVICSSKDITERKQMEEALRVSEERFKSIVSTSQEWIWAIDPEGRHTFSNPAIENILGYHPDELIGQYALHLLHEDDIPKVEELLTRSVEQKTGWPNLVLRWRHKDGTYRYLETNAVPIFDQAGVLKGFQGSDRDITERKHMEEEWNRLQQRLQQAEKMEALGTLAGGVAHDLNNVLGILVGYSELLMFDMAEDHVMRSHVENIMDGSVRAAAIVQDLLTLARRGVLTEKVVNLNSILTDCQKTPEFESLRAAYPQVRIKIELARDLLNIKGSASHVSKTFMNLLNNAVEAMPKGGNVTVTTGGRNLDTPVHGYDDVREGDYVLLSVSDTGEGIADADIKHIFEPFYTKKVMGRSGTGLGLAVVWGTVKDHNGYIDVQSKQGEGTTVTLYFPVTREEIVPSPMAVPLSVYIGKDESILVVDDIKEQRELAARMLGNLNYRVSTVSSGEEAVEYLKSHEVDLIVLDMIMHPGMDGLDTYKRILEIHPKQRAIIVSGFSESDRVQAAQSLGAGAYVKKPYITERLGMAIRQEIDRLT